MTTWSLSLCLRTERRAMSKAQKVEEQREMEGKGISIVPTD